MPKGTNVVTRLRKMILEQLDASKAEDIVQIDLADKSDIADVMIIASGTSTTHVSAIASKLLEKIKHTENRTATCDGLADANWVLIDTGDIIVHIFRPQVRSYYNIEKMWEVDLPKQDSHGELVG